MNKFFWKLLPGLLLVTLLAEPAWAQQQQKVATLDLRKVFDNYWKRKQADAAIKERAAEMEKEHTKMVEDYTKSRKEYEALLASASDQAVSSEERDKRKRLAEERLRQLKDTETAIGSYERQARTNLDEQLRRMRENILGEIRTVINAKAQAAGYSMVFDTAAESKNETPILLYVSNKDNDLTDAVLSQLNSNAPSDSSKPEEKAPERAPEKKAETRKGGK